MKKLLWAIIFIPFILYGQSQRQTQYVSVPDGFAQNFIETGSGGVLAGYSRYGSDSSLISFIFLNDSDEVVAHKEFNTATRYDFASHIIPVSGGYLIGGKSSDTSFYRPQIIKTDLTGNVLWSNFYGNLSSWQGQIIRIIPGGSGFSLYTYAETPFNDVYRLEVDASGSNLAGFKYTPDILCLFRVFDAEAIQNSSSHILCGHANFNSSSTRGGLLMKTTASGVEWARHITAGGNFKNDIVDVMNASDGYSYSLFVCENIAGNQYSTIVLKLDSAGNQVWARQLSVNNGTVNGCSIVEGAPGEFYVASYDNALVAYLCKMDASGNLLWTKTWNPSATSGASNLKLFKEADGDVVMTGMIANNFFLARLNEDADGCNFTSGNDITAATISPIVTNIPFSATAFSPVAVSQNTVYSSINYSENLICGGVGIDEEESDMVLPVFPSPAGDYCIIQLPQLSRPAITLEIYNAIGERMESFASGAGTSIQLNISGYQSGVYFVSVFDGLRKMRGRFVKE